MQKAASATPAAQLASFEQITMRSGPLPDPDTLKEYQGILSSAPDRIFTMAEKEQARVHENQRADNRAVLLGQIFGFIIGLTGVAGGIILVALDKSLFGMISLLSCLGMLVAAAVWGKIEDRRRKQRPQPKP